MGAYQKYYRILYSLFAILSLSGVLWMHFQIPDQRIWSRNQLLLLIGSVSGFTGLSIVLVCVRKYFFDLSGIDIFLKFPLKMNSR